MSDISPKLALPFIQPSQAQKHVTHNEAIQRLDVLVQAVVKDSTLATPPAAPDAGDSYIVPVGGTGVWAGRDDDIATFRENGWEFITPKNGWSVHDLSRNTRLTCGDAGWSETTGNMQVAQLGISASPDATNRLSVSSPASLLNHAGGGHQLKLNKAAPADTASLLFQSGFSGRAEMGLAGSDGWSLKVSADGATWKQALHVDAAAETVSIAPAGTSRLRVGDGDVDISVPITGTAVQASATDATVGRVLLNGAHGLGADTAPVINDFTAELRPGLYRYLEATSTGAPGSGAAWFGSALVLRPASGDGRVTILATRASPSTPRTWIGSRSGTTGAINWIEVFSQTSILGTVAQSGGVPTGAVIERGSNANGAYVRFADGTQICTQTASMGSVTASGAGTLANPYRTSPHMWTFPAVFASSPSVSGVATVDDTTGERSAIYLSHFSVFSTSSARLIGIRTTSASDADTVTGRLIAIGRWL